MFETLRQSFKTGIVTTSYPATPPEVSSHTRGKPEIDWANWKDARPAAAICPTRAIAHEDRGGQRVAPAPAKCIFCGLRADGPGHPHDDQCECAARRQRFIEQRQLPPCLMARTNDWFRPRLPSQPTEFCIPTNRSKPSVVNQRAHRRCLGAAHP
jgi:hypothetical protein